MNNYTGLTEKYLLGQKKRSLLVIIGIILSVTLITAIGTIGLSYRDKLIRQTTHDFGDYHVSFNGVPGEFVSKIVNQATVESAGGVDRIGYAVISNTSAKEKRENPIAAPYRYLNIKGYDPDAMNKLQVQLDSGRLPQNPNEIILSAESLSYFKTKPTLGERITLNVGSRVIASTGELKPISGLGDFGWDLDEAFRPQFQRQFTIVGFTKPFNNSSWSSRFIFQAITYDNHQKIDPDQTYFVYLKMKSMDHMKEKTENIISSLQMNEVDQGSAQELSRENYIKNMRVEYNNELLKLYGKSTYEGVNQSIILAFIAVILIIIGCTSAVIYNTFHISVLERTSQFGMLRCIGATPAQIRHIVVKEAALLSLIGIPIGLFTGTILMKLLFYNISLLTLGFLNDMQMVISVPVLVGAGLLGLLTVFLSAIGPARSAAKTSPLEAITSTGVTKVEQINKIAKSMFIKKIFGIEGQFAIRNIKRNKKRFRITAFSMIISMVLFIVFNSLIGLLSLTTHSGIDYSYSIQYDGSSQRMDDSVYRDLVKLDAVDQAYPFYNHQMTAIIPKNKINPKYYELRKGMYQVDEGLGYRTDNNYLQSYGEHTLETINAKLVAGTVDKEIMDRENGVVLIQKLSMITENGKQLIIDQTQFKVGDYIQIRSNSGRGEVYQNVKVVGIADQGPLTNKYNESAGITYLTTPKVIMNLTGDDTYSRIFILAHPDLSNKPVTDYLKSLTQKDAGFNYTDRVAELEQAHNDAITAKIFFYGFIGIIVLIAFLNILNTVSTNLILRTKEFAVLKAIGMTQREVNKMILLEGVFYGVYAAMYGSIIGTGLSFGVHYLFRGMLDIEWSLPWLSVGIAASGAVVTALIATAWPMYRLTKSTIVDSLRKEN
ncbi:ABC transporter permease [Paenibacillus sp. SAF-068]|uniref:ABC transporter permease n=1 Tax=Paenibacillus sp. SAF-068 TaxID=3436864 RepID=UPI003F81A5F4